MDFTGKFEQLDEDYGRIAERLGKTRHLPVTKTSQRGDYREIYTSVIIDIVRRYYAADLKFFWVWV